MRSTDGTNTSSNPKHQNSKYVCVAWHFRRRARINHAHVSTEQQHNTVQVRQTTRKMARLVPEKHCSAKFAPSHRHRCMTRYKLLLVVSVMTLQYHTPQETDLFSVVTVFCHPILPPACITRTSDTPQTVYTSTTMQVFFKAKMKSPRRSSPYIYTFRKSGRQALLRLAERSCTSSRTYIECCVSRRDLARL